MPGICSGSKAAISLYKTGLNQILQYIPHIAGFFCSQPQEHQPGTYPKFLAGKGVKVIIAGGLGVKAQELFTQNNIEVFIGVNSDLPEKLVQQYLYDQLLSGQDLCDH